MKEFGCVTKNDWASRIPGLAALWAETSGIPEVCIAVLDGTVDASHPCFIDSDLLYVQNLDSQECPSHHGTHIASVIFGSHKSIFAGLAPGCRGVIVPIYGQRPGGGLASCSQVDLARAILLALEQGAHVISISGGQLERSGEAHPLLARAVRACGDQGALIVAAAGNDGCACLHVPAALPSVLAVGAMDDKGTPLDFSNFGPAYQQQGILALGQDIPGAKPGGGIARRSGTSWATPIVSGLVALLLSRQIVRGCPREPFAIRDAILKSALGCDVQPTTDCQRLLAGRLHLPGALRRLSKGESMQPSDFDLSNLQIQTPSHSGGDAPPQVEMDGIDPSGCACGGDTKEASKPQAPSLVYSLGTLGHDYATEARRDSFIQQGLGNPHDPARLLGFLDDNPHHAHAITWTLNQDTTPIYGLQPGGPFAGEVYATLRRLYRAQLEEGVGRVSVPGWSSGQTQLSSGQKVPVIWPELRGMYAWSTPDLVVATLGSLKEGASEEEQAAFGEQAADITNFLERVYHEIRNLGVSVTERAINYAATNAFQLKHIFAAALKEGMKLDQIGVERSPICRPESSCWDVKLTFFNPTQRMERARKVYRFTVDVSDVVPVTVGHVRSWDVF